MLLGKELAGFTPTELVESCNKIVEAGPTFKLKPPLITTGMAANVTAVIIEVEVIPSITSTM